MTTTYTSLLGLALPVTGELSGTWGDTVNNLITQYLDSSVAGALTVSSDTTLTKTTGTSLGSTSSQYAILIASGQVTNITITAPAASKSYLVINKSNTYTVKIRGSGPTTGATVNPNSSAVVAWNGSDFAVTATSDASLLTGTVTAANGGTGLSSYTIGDLVYASGTTTLSKLADVATGNALISGGVGVAPSWGKIDLTTHVSGTLPVANGGTGASTLTANNVLLGNGTSAVQFVAPGTSGNVLTSNGTTWTSSAPSASLLGTTSSATPFATFLGYQAGNSNTGTGNVFVGYRCGTSNVGGNNNTALGYYAFNASTTGIWNVAVGNTAMQNSTCSNSTAVGYGTLVSTTGNNNTALGYIAGSNITSGTNNTLLGSQTSASSATVSTEIVVGYALTGKGTQTAYIGGTSGAYNAKNVTTWETTSDERIKRNIVDSPKGLAEINQLRVRNFNYKPVDEMPLNEDGKPIIDNLDPNKLITGFIAQELQTVMPECVNTTASGLLSVSSDPIIYALVKAVQELSAEINKLKG